MLIRIFRFLKPYRLSVTMVFILIFLQSLANLFLPTLMSHIVDNGVTKGNIPYIWRVGGLMLMVAIGSVCCSVASSFLASSSSAGFGKILRGNLFSHVENFTLHEFNQLGTSSLITRTTNDIRHVQQLVNMMLRMMVRAPMMCIGGIIMAVYTNAKLSLIIVVVVPVLALTIFLVFRRAVGLFRAIQKKMDKLNRVLREGLTGIRVIRSFNRIDYEQGRFDEANFDLADTATRAQKIMALMMPAMMLIMNFSTIAIIWFGGQRISNGSMQVGSLIAFIQYATQILFSVMMVSMMFFMIPRAAASAVRINEVLDTEIDMKDVEVTKCAPEEIRGEIEFRDVTFSYPGAEQPALTGISFKAVPGQVTAIIGGTGAGKSTLIQLIPRFYDVDEGSVLVDGVDVREVTQADLRAKIGFVPQKSVLFSGTIAENIRYGKEDATNEEIRHAAEVAQATEFIAGMAEEFESTIAQGGSNLSGGQKQRLAIARALVRKPEIYIFDDSFSALDFKTDAKLRSALRAEVTETTASAATMVIVAQRVSTVMDADMIIVLDDGRIVGMGDHHTLMQSCEVYREIVSSQLSEEEIA